MQILIEDVASVIRGEGQERAIIVGHDWGSGIAWSFAGWRPEMTSHLVIMNDTALLPDSLNDTWDELDQDWTLVTVPGAGHWPHHDKPDAITNMMRAWLALHAE
ncbi:hypothetical protein N9I87_00695 [Gammaproteobacteria bacterium]|jgi:pimeloyl-ACP methyl ester carboxylesterase|nr:hypothetical protein [Gammaproteobacteria bacterium]MDA8927731.1 hypothetical protein [Gammaproteobacteria bacterium]MDA9311173.1 hypothetical protein [Gammaproteobacteria bacterium]MDA9871076.1 hypothetical protein [Gammaproteobacteria bacterium]MDB2483279.1 hypothetical protein [Gammaproteobacteria bacterium]